MEGLNTSGIERITGLPQVRTTATPGSNPSPLRPLQQDQGTARETFHLPILDNAGDAAGSRQLNQPLMGKQGAGMPRVAPDLGPLLETLGLPATQEYLATAQGLAESGVPLTADAVRVARMALASALEAGPQAYQAAGFLLARGLPVTGSNVATLTRFLSTNPRLGTLLFDVQQQLSQMATRRPELAGDLSALVGRYLVDPKGNLAALQAGLLALAREAGCEIPGTEPTLRDRLWTLAQLLEREAGPDAGALGAALGRVRDELSAHRLLNAKLPGDGVLYWQVPWRDGDQPRTAEVRVRYRRTEDGPCKVEARQTTLELRVDTDHLGTLLIRAALDHGTIHVAVLTEDEAAASFVERELPALADTLAGLGWRVAGCEAAVAPAEEDQAALPGVHALAAVSVTG